MKPKMNDLIRRKDVMAALEEVFDDYKMSWGEQYGGFASAVPNAIGNIPTAYNEKSVVQQLEEASYWTDPTYDEDGYPYGDEIEVIDLSDAIEIVKGGTA